MFSHGTKKTLGNTSWFTHDRFGMFIHLVECVLSSMERRAG